MSAGRTVPVKQPPPPDMADIDAIAAEGERSDRPTALMTAGIDKSMVSDETLARQVKRWHERRERLAR